MSLNAQRKANTSSNAMSRTLQRLSSGMRVNSARDDAAGLAISERMTTKVRGLNQAQRNMNDAVSMLQTAEGSMQEITNLLQRGRVLALQANNSTNGTTDRQSLQAEINQIVEEIERITQTASFNGKQLFTGGPSGSGGSPVTLLAEKEAIIDKLRTSWLEQSEDIIQNYLGLTGTNVELKIILDDDIAGASAYVTGTGSTTLMNLELHIDVNELAPLLDVQDDALDQLIAHEMTHAIMAVTTNFADMASNNIWFAEGVAEFVPGGDARLNNVLTTGGYTANDVANNIDNIQTAWSGSDLDYATAYAATRYLHSEIGGNGVRDMLAYLSADTSRTLDDYFATGAVTGVTTADEFVTAFRNNGAAFIGTMDLADGVADTGAIGGNDADGGERDTSWANTIPDTANYTTDPLEFFVETWPNLISLETNETLDFQVGAEAGQTISISTRRISSSALGVDTLDVVDAAEGAIQTIDDALAAIDSERAKLGAAMNRMDIAITAVATTSENISAARSRILDTDFAKETLALTRSSILQRASNAIIAQANIQPQNVLRLLS